MRGTSLKTLLMSITLEDPCSGSCMGTSLKTYLMPIPLEDPWSAPSSGAFLNTFLMSIPPEDSCSAPRSHQNSSWRLCTIPKMYFKEFWHLLLIRQDVPEVLKLSWLSENGWGISLCLPIFTMSVKTCVTFKNTQDFLTQIGKSLYIWDFLVLVQQTGCSKVSPPLSSSSRYGCKYGLPLSNYIVWLHDLQTQLAAAHNRNMVAVYKGPLVCESWKKLPFHRHIKCAS